MHYPRPRRLAAERSSSMFTIAVVHHVQQPTRLNVNLPAHLQGGAAMQHSRLRRLAAERAPSVAAREGPRLEVAYLAALQARHNPKPRTGIRFAGPGREVTEFRLAGPDKTPGIFRSESVSAAFCIRQHASRHADTWITHGLDRWGSNTG